MATITLKEGDFGADVQVNVGPETIYLPDREHPGLTLAVPFTDVVEMDSTATDHAKPLKAALKYSAKGLFSFGPVGLAAGVLAATKARDVTFAATLRNGRRFVAMTDARSYAEIHARQLAARTAGLRGADPDDEPNPADEIIAKYLQAAKSEHVGPSPSRGADEPSPERRAGDRRTGDRRQPTFGRRGSS